MSARLDIDDSAGPEIEDRSLSAGGMLDTVRWECLRLEGYSLVLVEVQTLGKAAVAAMVGLGLYQSLLDDFEGTAGSEERLHQSGIADAGLTCFQAWIRR